jgi:hypothetical protein
MRFLLDENLEREVFLRLKNDDHEVRHVGPSDHLSKGASDSDRRSELVMNPRWLYEQQ